MEFPQSVDILEHSEDLKSQWETLKKWFGDLDKCLPGTVSEYAAHQEVRVKEAMEKIEVFFGNLLKEADKIKSIVLSADVIKVWMIEYCLWTNLFVSNPSLEMKHIKTLQTLNNVLLLHFDENRALSECISFNIDYLKDIKRLVEHFVTLDVPIEAQKRDLNGILFEQIVLSIALAAASYENRKSSSKSADDCIISCFSFLDKLMSHPSIFEHFQNCTCDIGTKEKYVRCLYGKKVFLGFNPAPISTLIYYYTHLGQLRGKKKLGSFDETVLEIIEKIFKHSLVRLNKGENVTVLNSQLFKLIRQIFIYIPYSNPKVKAIDFKTLLTSLFTAQCQLALKQELLTEEEKYTKSILEAPLLCTLATNPIAQLFKFFVKLRKIKTLDRSTSFGKSTFASEITEILMEIIQSLDKLIENYPKNLDFLKNYVVDVFFECRGAMSKAVVETMMIMIQSKLFQYFKFDISAIKSENLLDSRMRRQYALALCAAVSQDKNLANGVFGYMLSHVEKLISTPTSLISLLWLLYCGITSEPHPFELFVQNTQRFTEAFEKEESQKPLEQKMPKFEIKHHRSDVRSIQAFIDNKGSSRLLLIVLDNLTQGRDSPGLRLVEQLIIMLMQDQLIAESILKTPEEFLKLLDFPSHFKIFTSFLIKLALETIKQNKQGASVTPSKFIPNKLLLNAFKLIEENTISEGLLLVDIVIDFLDISNLNPQNQNSLFSSETIEHFVGLLSKSPNPHIGKLLIRFLILLFNLSFSNEAIRNEINTIPFISNNNFNRILMQAYLVDQTLNLSELFEIICVQLSIAFQCPIKSIEVSERHLVTNQLFFTLTLQTLFELREAKPESSNLVQHFLIYILKSIGNSFLNMLACAKNDSYKIIFDFLQHYRKNKSIRILLLDILTQISCVHASSERIKNLLSEFNLFRGNPYSHKEYCGELLNAVEKMIDDASHRKIFSFSEDNSGIGLLSRKSLPKEGYCFTGWVRVERMSLAKRMVREENEKMIIFELGASKDKAIEFFIQDSYFNYSIVDIKGGGSAQLIVFSQEKIIEDKWYFIELFHFNNESTKSLQLFLNGELIKECYCKSYLYKLDYDENAIGCGVVLEFVERKGEERIRNCFHGEMSTLYFFEVTPKTAVSVHQVLNCAYFNISMENFLHFICYRPSFIFGDRPGLSEIAQSLIDKIFIQVNPAYANKMDVSKERMYTYGKKTSKTSENLYNHIERIYPELKIHYNTPAKDILCNVGGVKIMMPLLKALAGIDSMEILKQVLRIFIKLAKLDRNKAVVFFECEEGILIFKYLLQSAIESCSKKKAISEQLFAPMNELFEWLARNSTSVHKNYLEWIYLNPDFTHSLSLETLNLMIKKAITESPKETSNLLGILANFVESFIEMSPDHPIIPQALHVLQDLSFKENSLNLLLGYVNLFYVRRLTNYPLHISVFLRIIVFLYMNNKEKLHKEIKQELKIKKDSKLLSTIFVLAEFFLNGPGPTLDKPLTMFLSSYPEAKKIIDTIIGSCMYILLSFNWGIFSDLAKEVLKEDSKNPVQKNSRDIILFILSSLGKSINQKSAQKFIIDLLFSGEKRNLGFVLYKSLLSVSLEYPPVFAAELQIPLIEVKKGSEKILLKSPYAFESIFQCLEHMPIECLKKISQKDAILKSGKASNYPINPNFKYPELRDNSRDLLCRALLSQPTFFNISTILFGDIQHKLQILTTVIEFRIREFQSDILSMTQTIYFCYALENIVFSDLTILFNPEFLNALSLLIILVHKLDLMYISVPTIVPMDERTYSKLSKEPPDSLTHREGGVLRIILKLTLLTIKYDVTKNIQSFWLLRFILFRKKDDRKNVKETAGILRSEKIAKKKSHKQQYNLIDLIYKSDKDKMKKYKATVEMVIKKIIGKQRSILDSRQISKSSSSYPKDKGIFEISPLLLSYIFVEIFHILHFDLLKIESYREIVAIESTRIKALDMRLDQPVPLKFQILSRIFEEIIRTDIHGQIYELLGRGVVDFLQFILVKKGAECLPYGSDIRLGVVFSSLDVHINLGQITKMYLSAQQAEEKQENKLGAEIIAKRQEDAINRFQYCWETFLKSIIEPVKKAPDSISAQLFTEQLLTQEQMGRIQPMLLFLATQTLTSLDVILLQHCINENKINNEASKQQSVSFSFSNEFFNLIRNKSPQIAIAKEKIEHDELRSDFKNIGLNLFEKLLKDQESEVGVFYDATHDTLFKDQYAFVREQFMKKLRRCALHSRLMRERKFFDGNHDEFVKLSKNRDKLGRSLLLKRNRKIHEGDHISSTFAYLRQSFLKKILLSCFPQVKKVPIQDSVYQFPLFRNLFVNLQKKKHLPNTLSETKESKSSIIDEYESSAESSELEQNSPAQNLEVGECIPNKKKLYEVEVITITGAIFGRLSVNSLHLSFRSCDRPSGKQYGMGSSKFDYINKKVNKKWKVEAITEIIVKRFNLLRQAVEIYLKNYKSVFLIFFSDQNCKKFLIDIKQRAQKKGLSTMKIIENPEEFFSSSQYKEQWTVGDICNFDYLMLLNKYGGRTMNDLRQYPVFPWLFSDFTSSEIDLLDEKVYRPLKLTIAAISENKRKLADEKYSHLSKDSSKESQLQSYQFASHYLPGRIVLEYLLRIEPYSSILLEFEKGNKIADRMFHIMASSWMSINIDAGDNKEMIPEFFYTPEFLLDSNCLYFGSKFPSGEVLALCDHSAYKVQVSNVILPKWTSNPHFFIKQHALGLESKLTSSHLEQWIDLIFGSKQQETKYYNRFKETCDEITISRKLNELSEFQIVEIQEFGTNPIKLFHENHPAQDLEKVETKLMHVLFSDYNENASRFALIKLNSFDRQPIIFISAFKNRAIVVLGNNNLYRSKEEYLNVPHEKSFLFEKKEIRLFPLKKIYENNIGYLYCDSGRAFACLEQGNKIITCRHFDNSFKITNTNNGEVDEHIFFHNAMVTVVCSTWDEKYLFTASADGLLAKWNIAKEMNVPNWFCCDLSSPIITMDACSRLNLVAVASRDGVISLREINSGKFCRLIRPNLKVTDKLYQISYIRLSFRGYIILILQGKNRRLCLNDYLLTYSVNGELIYRKDTGDTLSTLQVIYDGYSIITGGSMGRILKYDILSYDEIDLFEHLDNEQEHLEEALKEILNENVGITFLRLTLRESCQQLLIGLSNGSLYTYKYSPRLIGGKIFHTLQGLI